jgi:hypothetical protein
VLQSKSLLLNTSTLELTAVGGVAACVREAKGRAGTTDQVGTSFGFRTQTDASALERQIANAAPPVVVAPKPKMPPDMDFYITISENARKRAEALEKENLEVGR